MHPRGLPSSTEISPQETQEEYDQTTILLNSHIPLAKVPNQELTCLGAKDPDYEIEKFIQGNTKKLAENKWLCLLSGKKFKGPEFVRKHIYNKFSQELEEIKKEVDNLNKYLGYSKIPQIAENSGYRRGENELESCLCGEREFGHFSGHDGFGRERETNFRPKAYYIDLDAPNEPNDIIFGTFGIFGPHILNK